MAEVKMPATWHIILDPAEARLILRALGGRIESAEEMDAAKKLGDQLTIARTNVVENLYRGLKRNSDQIEGD